MGSEIEELRGSLENIMAQVKGAVDTSIEIKKSSPGDKRAVSELWETFLRQFFLYTKEKGKESKLNLLADISMFRITKK